jgi:hypothetical protein
VDLGVKTMARVMKKRIVDMRRTRPKVVFSGGAVRDSVRRCMVNLLMVFFFDLILSLPQGSQLLCC